jgi:hypothetical protein
MTISADDLQPQLSAALHTFEKMSTKERETPVSKIYAERFNALLILSKEAMPEIDSRQWPAPIPIKGDAMARNHIVDATYADIRALLAEVEAIVSGGTTPIGYETI